MNYLITAAGKGSRFLNYGIKPPKPLIKVFGTELLLWSLRSLDLRSNDNLFLVTFSEHKVKKRLEKKLNLLYPNINIFWFEIESILNGQLLTALKAIEVFDITGELIIHNCDTSYQTDFELIKTLLHKKDTFGVIPCFNSEGDHWSFAKTSVKDPQIALEVREKIRISNNCSVGTYVFSSAKEFQRLGEEYQSKNSNNMSEFFIAPVFQLAIEKSKIVNVVKTKNVKLFGTPKELILSFGINFYELLGENSWSAHQIKTIVVDIDKTLCETDKDYSKSKPIKQICNALKKAHNQGHYIILFTSRNMRSFRGSLGLINKYTAPILLDWLKRNEIPFDEIYYGKPWGNSVSYLDDKMISIEEFIKNN